jgi:uncharacterized protein (DUF58 family)
VNAIPGGLTRNSGLVDPASLMRIASMELRAKVVVDGLYRGIHRSSRHGFSTEFTEYRQYVDGDDLRYLDWRVLARSDRQYIKKFEDETSLRCHLVADRSRSMGYGSLGYTKADYAATLAATLAQFLFAQGDAVGLLTFGDQVDQVIPARNRHGHLRRIMHGLEQQPVGTSTDLGAPLQHIAEMQVRRGLLVLISDLFAPLDTLSKRLSHLRASGHDLVIFQVIDPVERDFTFEAPALFEDSESKQKLYIDPASAREDYCRRFREHGEAIRTIAAQMTVDFRPVVTDQPLADALFAFMNDRQRRGRVIQRHAARGGGR